MKNLRNVILLSICIFAYIGVNAQSKETVKSDTFTVDGKCEMCKARIENAALIKGVKSADWNQTTHIMTVIYNPQKVELISIHKAIANVGHKTNLVAPNMDAYNKLPSCCAYLKGGKENCGMH